MKSNLPIQAADPDRSTRTGRRPGLSPAARGLGALLAVALFGAHTFQPVIGLVEVRQAAKSAKPATDRPTPGPADPRPAAPQPVVVSIHAWQWYQHAGELWPVFVFQPTISADSNGGARLTSSKTFHAGPLDLPLSSLAWILPAPLTLRYLAQDPGQPPVLRLSWCRQVCPTGPPLA